MYLDKNIVAICKTESKTYYMDYTTEKFYTAYEKAQLSSSLLLSIILIANPILAILNKLYFPIASVVRNLIFFLVLFAIVWIVSRTISLNVKKANSFRPILLNENEIAALFDEGMKKIKVESVVYGVSIIGMLLFLIFFFIYSNLVFLILGMDCMLIVLLELRSDFFIRYKILQGK